MPLVQYPDSDSDSNDKSDGISAQPLASAPTSTVKRKRSASAQDSLPPLPAAFHDLYSTNARVSTSDTPSLHGGRKRTVPHIEGNWPSHLYLEWIPLQPEADSLHDLIQHIKTMIGCKNMTRKKKLPVPEIIPLLRSELGAPLPLHVSLSRTLQIQTEHKEAFIEALRASLRKAAVRTFHFSFHSLKWVPNFERNRWFLVLGIKKPAQDELNRLLDACNEATQSCGHFGLYTGGKGDGPMDVDPTRSNAKRSKNQQSAGEQVDRSEYFHISIAWNLEEPDSEWIALAQKVDVSKHIQPPLAVFDVVKARIGNMVRNINLGVKRPGLGLGFG